MRPGTRRCFTLTGVLWFCFLMKLVFYASFVPLWEGYDEFSHFAFVQYLVATHELPDLQTTYTSQEVAESLRLAPVAGTIRQWNADWITYDDFWRLPAASRRQREGALREIPRASAREPAPDLRLYEAQQPPLAYLLYAIPYAVFQGTGLLTRAWVLRIIGSVIASLVIPLGFLVARRVLGNELQAVGVMAVAASMPELLMLTDHAGNEPLALVLCTACVYALVRIAAAPRGPLSRGLFLGCLLGCGLLTKAYFLTLIPAILVIYAVLLWRNPEARGRIAMQLVISFAAAIAVAGWWYGRAIYATGTLTGHEVMMAAHGSTTPFLQGIGGIQWRRAADFALFSHIWLGGWSFLVLRTWMYRTVEFILLVACAGLPIGFRRAGSTALAICVAVQFFFWAGLVYFMLNTYAATGQGGEPGYYAYALVVPEAVCLVAGISALIRTRFVVPGLVICFAAMEVYGTVFCLMPYYAGITAHNARGTVPAMHAGRLLNGGAAELFRNLAVNKPDILQAGTLPALCAGFLLAVAAVVAVSVLLALRGERGEARSGAANSLVALGPG